MTMSSLIETTTPLGANDTFVSGAESLTRATQITGSVYSDQNGTCSIQQSGDSINWDVQYNLTLTGGTGMSIERDVVAQYFRVVYTNGSIAQTTFRLFANFRDPYGDFLEAALAPSAGGQWAILFQQGDSYSYVGRFDGTDGWNANGNAAISQNKGGTYASFLVSEATVSLESIQLTTDHGPASF
jgi:hypothetical protein